MLARTCAECLRRTDKEMQRREGDGGDVADRPWGRVGGGGSRSISGMSCSVYTKVKRRHGPCSGMLQSCLRVQQADGGVFELERRQRRREQKGRNRALAEIAAR